MDISGKKPVTRDARRDRCAFALAKRRHESKFAWRRPFSSLIKCIIPGCSADDVRSLARGRNETQRPAARASGRVVSRSFNLRRYPPPVVPPHYGRARTHTHTRTPEVNIFFGRPYNKKALPADNRCGHGGDAARVTSSSSLAFLIS